MTEVFVEQQQSDLYDIISDDDLVEALTEAGFPNRKTLSKASYKELYPVRGLKKNQINRLIEAARDDLDSALDPIRAVADEYNKQYKKEYPDKAVVINFNENIITVGDFRKLAKALKNTKLFD